MHPNWDAAVLDIFCLVPALAFLVLYGFRSQWSRNYVGRGLMSLSASLNLALGYILFVNIWPTVPFRVEMRTGFFLIIAIALWWQLAVLLIAQRERPPNECNMGRRYTDVQKKENTGEQPCITVAGSKD